MKGKTSNLKVWETQLKNYISNELREPLNIEHVQTLNSERKGIEVKTKDGKKVMIIITGFDQNTGKLLE